MSVYDVTTFSGFELYQIRVHYSIIVCSIQTHCELMLILMTHMCTWKKSTTMQSRFVVYCNKYILTGNLRKLQFNIRISTITCTGIYKLHLCKLVFYEWIKYRGDEGGVKYCCVDKHAHLIVILAQFNIVYIGKKTASCYTYLQLWFNEIVTLAEHISNLFEYIFN